MARRMHGRRGFFLIWGWRTRISLDGSGAFHTTCPSCRTACQLEGMQARRWFTLYFIPCIPMGAGKRFTQCNRCKAQFAGTLDEMKTLLDVRGPVQDQKAAYQAAIELFNEMRDTPRDSEKLLKLLHMYAALNEPREAVSAGYAFNEAAEKSDACLAVLAQSYLGLSDKAAAVRHAAAALALNPENKQAAEIARFNAPALA